MKCKTKIRLALFIFLISIPSIQQLSSQTQLHDSPLLLSIESGELAIHAGCTQEGSGCTSENWTSKKKFQIGDHIWLKVIVINRSDRDATRLSSPEIPDFLLSVVSKNDSTPAKLTPYGCTIFPSNCGGIKPNPNEPVILHRLDVPLQPWIVTAGESNIRYIEVTREYEFSRTGTYLIDTRLIGFILGDKAKSEGGIHDNSTPVRNKESAGMIVAHTTEISLSR